MKENPELTKMYKEYLSAKAESNKKAAKAKQAEINEKTKQQQENQNKKKFLNGTSPTSQSSRAGYNGPAPGNNKVPINRIFAKRNFLGRIIDSKPGKPYPGQ